MTDDLIVFPEENKTRTSTELVIGDCLEVVKRLRDDGVRFDAIVTDPPYEINYMNKAWDSTGVAFSVNTWALFREVLKPGGFLLAFSATRLYHRMAVAIEDAGYEVYPMLAWQFPGGLPKPMNVANLFDRDNQVERKVVGTKKASGYTKALVQHGVQNYNSFEFAQYETAVSDEAKEWNGYYYGVNTLKPAMEPIFMGRNPISEPRVIDNLRVHRTGAINIGELKERRGGNYPTNVIECRKSNKNEHQSDHPTVKPTLLMEDLVTLVCPKGGRVLDPFAGTGTTGIACQNVGRDCTLIEHNPDMEPVIRRRLNQG